MKALVNDSAPRFFYDPVAAATHPLAPGPNRSARRALARAGISTPSAEAAAPRANPSRIAGAMLERLVQLPGWLDFQSDCAHLSMLTSTPGWEDADGRRTQPSAKPVGMAQWGAAMQTAGMFVEFVHGLGFPKPGADPEGFLWLNWHTEKGTFALQLHTTLLCQSYRWRQVLDGMPRDFETTSFADVVEALRAFDRSVS